jgi:hypothetical protein
MAKATSTTIPISYLRDCFDCDPATGVIRWRERPLSHFSDERAQRLVNTQHAGREAGTINATNGYRGIILSVYGQKIQTLAHRVVWALAYGEWPKEIDHRNRIRTDNRLSNLREATHAQNHQNRTPRGASLDTRNELGRWHARIGLNYQRIYLGTFDTEEDAHQAYLAAKAKYHLFT